MQIDINHTRHRLHHAWLTKIKKISLVSEAAAHKKKLTKKI
jgi:hypothetical protein